MASSLVYCDERLVVINKPPGLSLVTSHRDPQAAAGRLLDSLSPETREAWGLLAASLRLVHRLDAGTTGLVLLARDVDTHRELVGFLNRRLMSKTYLALVWGHPAPPSGNYEWPLGPDRRDRRRMKADPDGRPSLSRYQTLARGPHVSLLALHPVTGRTHQLRVHLAHAGHWIVGDDLYGGSRHRGVRETRLRAVLNPPHILLHSWRIELPAAPRLQPSRFEAPLPPAFDAALEKLEMTGALLL